MRKLIRCAIYTRKSTEEGLEQDFNSLDAQREACEAYIKSQKHEGWIVIEKEYNDGGYSGGTMERPAFKELLEDVKEGKIDIVVVYKVDRLTRSLMDFSKIIEVFDSKNASFVSITQHFNTTTSMGRLTLNILLSFAQFEREVTGERIRDKLEASRQKGLWVTGVPPYGYEKGEHHVLQPQQPYADNVRVIFEEYVRLKTLKKLGESVKKKKIFSRSGKPLCCSNLARILSSKIYIGKLEHNNKVYDGQHEPLISEELFNKARNILQENSVVRNHHLNAKNISLLAGLAYDDKGNKMAISYSSGKNGKQYRRYMSWALKNPEKYERGQITQIAAGELDKYVKDEIAKMLQDQGFMQKYLDTYSVEEQTKILNFMQTYEPDVVFIRESIKRVDLRVDLIQISYDMAYMVKSLASMVFNSKLEHKKEDELIIVRTKNVKISLIPQRQNKIIIPGERNYDMRLIQALIKSFWYNKLGAKRQLPKEALNGNNKRLRKLRFLPPDIIESIMNGTQDPELNVTKLIEMAKEFA